MTMRLSRVAWSNFLSLSETDSTVESIANVSTIKVARANEQIINQAGESDRVYLVQSGLLSAIKYTANGHEILLSEIQSGQLVGELSILASTERSSAVVVTSEAVLVAIPADSFRGLCVEHSVLATAVMKQLADRLIRTSTVLSEQISMSVPSRLYGELVRSGNSLVDDDEVLIIDPIPSVTGLARKIHATREATSRAMTALQARGLIRKSKSLLEVVTPKY